MGQLGENQLGTDQLGSPGTIRETEEWRVRRDDDIEEDLYNAQVVDTANPFGNFAIAKIDDENGTKFEQYSRGTKVEFFAKSDSGDAFTSRFVGYVVEARELDEQGADALEVEVYSFDQFLRRDTVSNDQSGKSLESALQDIIETDTPVTWDASNVTVEDPQTLTQSYRGENVENALLSLRGKSGGEEFGVNEDLEFFWRPLESSSAPRDIDNSQWSNYDLPEEGKRTINEVTVFFDSGSKNVTVDNGADKSELQDALGTADPVVLSEEVSRPDITDIDDARAVAERILAGKESILTGTVTTFGLLDAEPGDIIDITITPRGIDTEFRIAELNYRWGRGQTVITVAEKRGDQDDLLVNLSDTLKRVELDGVDRDATANTVTSTNLRALISVTGDVDGTSYDSDTFTNVARNKMRSGWAGDGNLDIADIAVGNNANSASKSQEALGNELERVSASEALPDSTTARYTASFSTTDIREVGLFDSGGDMIARATIPETALTASVDVTIDLSVSNDSGYGSGVVTNDGQTAIRDVIADNSPALPTDYAYGDDNTTPAESDTALGNQLVEVGLDEILVQSAATNTQWEDITSIEDTDPVAVQNGNVELLQSTAFLDPEFDFKFEGLEGPFADSTAQDGAYMQLSETGQFVEFEFTFDYTVPSPRLESGPTIVEGARHALRCRLETDNEAPEITISIDGNVIQQGVFDGISSTTWQFIDNIGQVLNAVNYQSYNSGEPVTFRIEVTDETAGQDGFQLDTAHLVDGRFNYTFDESDSDSNGTIAGPELYPDQVLVPFNTVQTRRSLQTATATQSWTDTSNNQYIELSNDGGSTWHTTNNTETAMASFASASTQLQTRIRISRFGSGGTDSQEPRTGFDGQNIQSHDLEADIDAITPSDIGVVNVQGIVPPNTVNGQTIREAAQLDTSGNALTRSTFADIDVAANERVISSEDFEWAND